MQQSCYYASESGDFMNSCRVIFTTLVVLLMLPIVLISANADVGELHVEWQQFLPGISGESVVQTSDGGFLVLGRNATIAIDEDWDEPRYFNTTHLLAKTDGNGNLMWMKCLPLNESHSLYTLIETSDGGYVLGGTKDINLPWSMGGVLDFVSLMPQLFLLKIDSLGNIQWSGVYQNYDGVDSGQRTSFKSLIQTSDGGFALAGGYLYMDRVPRIWFVKTDSSGNREWSKTISGVDNAGSVADFRQTSDGGYMIISSYYMFAGRYVEAIKLDADGDTQWVKQYSELESNSASVYCATVTNDEKYLMCGTMQSEPHSDDYVTFLVKIDNFGDIVWETTYNESFRFHSVAQTAEDEYVFVATTGSNSSYAGSATVFKTDSEGNIEGKIEFECEVFGCGNSLNQVIVTNDGGYVSVGTLNEPSYPTFMGDEKFWLVKIDSAVTFPDTTSPSIDIDLQQNETYTTDIGFVTFTVDEETLWMGYSLDGQDNVTLTEKSINLTGLSDGKHNIIVYATDTAGNTGTTGTISFTINKEPEQSEWLPLIVALALILTLIAAGLGLLIYLNKRK